MAGIESGFERDKSPEEPRKKVPEIRVILRNIADELTTSELNAMIFLARDDLPKGKCENMTPLTFLVALEERQLIVTKEKKMDYLVNLLSHLPRVDLMKKLTGKNYISFGYSQVENVVIEENVTINNCVVASASTEKNIVEIHSTTSSFEENEVSGIKQFLEEADVMYQRYRQMEIDLGEAMARNAELIRKNQELESEIYELKNDQCHLTQERNCALGEKAKFVFRESEAKKELNDLKCMVDSLSKESAKDKNVISNKDRQINELNETLKVYEHAAIQMKSINEKLDEEKAELEKQLLEWKTETKENTHVLCKRCGLMFDPANNSKDACVSHPGKFEWVGSVLKRREWSCCKSTNANAVGCCKKKHLFIEPLLSPGINTFDRKYTF